jgi:hypothetical protein
MVVAITHDLEHLKEPLSAQGHKVVYLGSYDYPIDAMIFENFSPNISYISNNNISTNADDTYGYGILMINAKNKSSEEINKILKTRLYSPLF